MTNKIIITGTSGTIGQVLVPFLLDKGFDIVPWDRSVTPINNYKQMDEFILLHKPIALIHLAAITSFDEKLRSNSWQVNYEWPSELAWICQNHKIKFIFTSTAMVFSQGYNGPFTAASMPDEKYGYGFEKRMAEEKVMLQNPESVILRLGWQIAENRRASREVFENSMLASLDKQMSEGGEITASNKWLPSCSFVQDTVDIIAQSLSFLKGIYQVNSNTTWSFYQIATALKNHYNKDWKIIQSASYIYDQRMLDKRIHIKTLESRLQFN